MRSEVEGPAVPGASPKFLSIGKTYAIEPILMYSLRK
jgi:hypothetical protein